MRTRIFMGAGLLVVSLVLGPAGAAGTVVKPTLDSTWDPKVVRVKKGTVVTWKADPNATHTIKSYKGTWMPKTDLFPGDVVKRRFKKTGTFFYVCTLHGHYDKAANKCHGMCGKVKVRS